MPRRAQPPDALAAELTALETAEFDVDRLTQDVTARAADLRELLAPAKILLGAQQWTEAYHVAGNVPSHFCDAWR